MFRLLLATLLCLFITTPSSAQTAKKKAPPTKEAPNTEAPKVETSAGKININTATATELTKLNGVGEVTAKKIVAYREANGPFKTVDDLNKVSGIGDKTFAKFRDQITVGDGKATAGNSGGVVVTEKTPARVDPAVSAGQLNINTATAAQLESLNGIGEVTAQKIVAYREANGPFKSIEELSKVGGIGPKTLDKFRDQINVGDGKATAPAPKEEAPKAVGAVSIGKININTATATELTKLNGVGEVTAKKIVAYREANGPFKTVDDLNKVSGIGDKTFAKFRDQITVGDGKATAGNSSGVVPVETGGPAVVPVTKTSAPVNINTADLKELGKLPGVGDTTGQRILDYRQANGPFKSCKDLSNVKGIGDKTLEKIEPSCTVK